MRRILSLVAICVFLGAMYGTAAAQAPAAFADGRKAYEAGLFQKARDLLLSASRTARRNPEVFLWLGKAHYQLGEVPEAIAAWQTTLRLAPGEPYAARMLKALRAEVTDLDVRIRLVEQLLAARQPQTALKECARLLADKALTAAQRAKLLALKAEGLLATKQHAHVLPIVLELRTKHPKAIDAVRLSLLLARAKLHLDDRSILDARASLAEIAADKDNAAAAAVAQYELMAFDLRQGPDAAALAKLAAWQKAHADHALAADALRLLVDSTLALTRRGVPPARDAALAATDVTAIGYVKLLRAHLPKDADRLKLSQQIDAHLQAHYDQAGAYAASIQGGEALRKLDLSRAERAFVVGRILDRHLAISRALPSPARDGKLAAADLAAVAGAKELLRLLTTNAEILSLTNKLLRHLHTRYVAVAADAVALQGAGELLKLELPQGSRASVLRQMVNWHLAVTGRLPGPAKDAKLAASDVAALARVRELFALLPADAERAKLVQQFLGHLSARYFAVEAHAAAIQGAEELLKLKLPQGSRVSVLGQMVNWHLAVTGRLPSPEKGAKLAASDVAALARVGELFALLPADAERAKLAQQFLRHFAARYAKVRAYAAAAQGVEAVLKLSLPRGDRAAALGTLGGYKTELAMAALAKQAAAGKLPAPMPASIREVLSLYATIRKEDPAKDTAAWRLALAQRLSPLASKLPPAVKVTGLSAPDAWAVEIAVPIIAEDKKTGAVQAVGFVDGVRKRYLSVKAPTGLRVSLDLTTRLLAAMGDDHVHWASTRLEHARVLGLLATWQFAENVRTGNDAKNAQLSDTQKQMIAALVQVVQRDARAQAAGAVSTLAAHLQPWQARGHYAVAEAAYDLLVASLPAAVQRDAKLAVARIWIGQVLAEHGRLAAAGLKVPVKLDPTLTKALKRCRELQGDLEEGDAFLKQVRPVWRQVVDHYNTLEYHATAAEAIGVKADPPAPAAERYAQLALADHRYAEARRELGRLIRQYNGRDKIALTATYKAALAAYRQFISQHGDSPLADTAVRTIFSIAQGFAAHEAHTTAAEVYREFAEFAAKVPTLAQAAPGAVSTAERAALAHAAALDAHARKALAKELADRKEKVPPAKLRPEFTAALAAYQQFVKDRPGSVLVAEAIRKVMAVALEYAGVDAWDVAEGIFVSLQKAGLDLETPERIELCRGLCHLGKVMPDHARSVLKALVEGHGRTGRGGKTALALAGPRGDARAKEPARKPGPTPRPVTPPPAGPAGSKDAKALLADLEKAEGGALGKLESRDEADMLAMAAIRQQQITRARQVAMLREGMKYYARAPDKGKKTQQAQRRSQQAIAPAPVLSPAELARQQKAFDAAYAIFQGIRKTYALRAAAVQARGEVLVMVGHWRAVRQWKRAAALAGQYLQDNATDSQLPTLRLGIARDTLAWASEPVKAEGTKQEKLAEVTRRFAEARGVLAQIVREFTKDRSLVQQAQWDIAGSFLTQARVVDQFSPTLARGQYVRAARELRVVGETFHDHPRIAEIPQMLWNIAEELARRRYYDEAMIVWNDLTIHYFTHALAAQAATRIAQTYEQNLGRPLKAAETYVEINFARGGSDAAAQNAIYQIGVRLRGQKRWVEALHVLETFVDSFPRHAQAGQALTAIGQIHQTNEAWEDAIAAYQRVIEEYPTGNWIREAKWSIAECRINRSEWREAMAAYEAYLKAYAKDARTGEAKRRMGVAKDLARYQTLVDEEGQRKAFDAQFQIARIVQEQLANPTKAITEYRKVAANWPKTHLADDALFQVGGIYLSMAETIKGREALLELAATYPESPLTDDALLKVGQSYEAEAVKLAGVTRGRVEEMSKVVAQREAYKQVQAGRRRVLQDRDQVVARFRAEGQQGKADIAQARFAAQFMQYNLAKATVAAQAAEQQVEKLTAAQLADRQDKINAALRRAVEAYQKASKVALADKADQALLQMAKIYDEKLKDSEAAMRTWQEIVRQFSGTAVAEDASWRIAQYHERKRQWAEAIQAYQAFLRNYRRSTRAPAAQFAIAENHEHLGEWVKAMDAYANYVSNFPKGPMVQKAKDQIEWIKTYRL